MIKKNPDEIFRWYKILQEFYKHDDMMPKQFCECLFWDRNGFVLYYKRLDKCKFKMKEMLHAVENITANELEVLLSGFDPSMQVERQRMTLEHAR